MERAGCYVIEQELNRERIGFRKNDNAFLSVDDAAALQAAAYRLTAKGTKVALLFVLFHKQLCGPLANSLFHHQPDPGARLRSKLESAYHKADASIRSVIQLLEAA